MNDFLKRKFRAAILFAVILISVLVVPVRAHAFWGIEDVVFDPQSLVEMVTEYVGQTVQWVEENWQRVMRDVIAKRIIDYTVDETVKWVQGGGDPKFVSDWSGFMKDAGAMAFDSTIKEMGMTDICQPFKMQLNLALIPENKLNRERVQCSISDIVANVQDFYDNFQNGGWLAYGASIKPENNLYMQLVMFDDEIKTKTNFNQNLKNQQVTSGQGFLSVSKCVEDDSQQLYDQCVAAVNQNGGDPSTCYDYAAQNKTCTKEEVQTPGSMVGKALGESITSDTQWAANIQSWTSALVNAAINRVTKEGIAAMKGSNANATPDYNPANSEYGDILGDKLSAEAKKLIDQVNTLIEPYQKYLTELQKRKGYIDQTIDLLQQMMLIDPNGICVPPATTAEITAQKALSDATQKEIDTVKPLVDRAASVVKQISGSTNDVRGRALAQGAATMFVDALSKEDQRDVQAKLGASYPQTAAALTTKNNTLDRFTQCKNKIDILQSQP